MSSNAPVYNVNDAYGVIDLTPGAWHVREWKSQFSLIIYAATFAATITILVLGYWLRNLKINLNRMSKSDREFWQAMRKQPLTTIYRMFQRRFIPPVWGFASTGNAWVTTIFVMANIILVPIQLDIHSAAEWASRFAWMSCGNLILLIFLALKNTPLSFLIGISHDRLNGLHKVAGYTAIVHAVAHALCCLAYFRAERDKYWVLLTVEQRWGYVSGAAFCLMPVIALIRRKRYEIFYVSHIVLAGLGIVTLYFHRPDFGTLGPYLTLVAAGIWTYDIVIRAMRAVFWSINNHAVITPLGNGATRVVLAKGPRMAAGAHAFLWIPGIRPFERHPFTIVSSGERLEFVIQAHTGFTKSLNQRAIQSPGISLWASIDGPYGTSALPQAHHYDKVVLVTGGAGATFAFGLLERFTKMACEQMPEVELVWSVKSHDQLAWFGAQLDALRSNECMKRVKTRFHVTGLKGKPAEDEKLVDEKKEPESYVNVVEPLSLPDGHGTIDLVLGETETSPDVPRRSSRRVLPTAVPQMPQDLERQSNWPRPPSSVYSRSSETLRPRSQDSTDSLDKTQTPLPEYVPYPDVHPGRPDIPRILADAVERTGPEGRILVAACGPETMVAQVRREVAGLIRPGGAAVEVHTEVFKW